MTTRIEIHSNKDYWSGPSISVVVDVENSEDFSVIATLATEAYLEAALNLHALDK